MKKYFLVLACFLIILGALLYFYYTSNNKNNNLSQDNSATKLSTEYTPQSVSQFPEATNSPTSEITSAPTSTDSPVQIVEIELSSFTTKIYNKENSRQHNIKLCSDSLNETVVKSGEKFSFNNVVGPANAARGYEEADIFNTDGEVVQGIRSGGKCQVSTTLYNAVNMVSGLTITERHEHSNDVPYVEDGKDATVYYGHKDFEFVNNTGNDIKIYVEATESVITVKIVSC